MLACICVRVLACQHIQTYKHAYVHFHMKFVIELFVILAGAMPMCSCWENDIRASLAALACHFVVAVMIFGGKRIDFVECSSEW